MIFRHFLLDVNEANAFVVGCEKTKEAALIDAGAWDPAIPAFLKEHGLRLTKIFITHDHYDHTDGLEAAAAETSAVVFSGADSVAGVRCTRLAHGDDFSIGEIEGSVVETPGHTPIGLTLILPGMAFTGDALFSGSVGGTQSHEDAQRQSKAIKAHIFELPDDDELHVGHGPSTTVWVEKHLSPFFT